MTHKTSIVARLPHAGVTMYRGTCSCGWVSAGYVRQANAEKVAERHAQVAMAGAA